MDILNFITQILSSLNWMALLINSFLSATILPLSSELLYLALLKMGQYPIWFLWLVATTGNSLGGITNLFIGRIFPEQKSHKQNKRLVLTATRWIQRYGTYSLLLSWVPIIGDVLCVVAGWQRLDIKLCALYITLGKASRYLILTIPFYL